jgi:polysaccharide biosynthesis transport protein
MELRQILSLIGKWLWLIILSVAIAAGSSYYASLMATPLYRTKTTLMVGEPTRNIAPSSADLYTGQQLAYTYSQLALREPVMRGVMEALGLQMNWQSLAGQINIIVIPNTQLMEISVIDSDPYRAKVIADEIGRQLILQSPAGTELGTGEDIEFIREQVDDLREKIKLGNKDLERLRQEMDASNSAMQIQDLENQIGLVENKIRNWQTTYSQLLLSLQGGRVNVLTIVEEAVIPTRPISPDIRMNVFISAVIGLVLAAGGVFLMEYLDDTIKNPEEIEKVAGLPTLGMIVQVIGKTESEKLIAAHNSFNPLVEPFRVLRNNIQYMVIDQPYKVLLVTSANPYEGKSLILANLAVVIANAGQSVILVDSDFRHPSQDNFFNISNESGLSTAIRDQTYPIDHYLQDVGVENLRVLPSGPMPPHPIKMLESNRMKERLKELQTQTDMVLFDSPPFMMLSDAAILSIQVDGVILVVDAGRTRMKDFQLTVKEMKRIHIPLIGVVLNHANRSSLNSYYYRYHNYRSASEPKQNQNGHEALRWLKRDRYRRSDVKKESP